MVEDVVFCITVVRNRMRGTISIEGKFKTVVAGGGRRVRRPFTEYLPGPPISGLAWDQAHLGPGVSSTACLRAWCRLVPVWRGEVESTEFGTESLTSTSPQVDSMKVCSTEPQVKSVFSAMGAVPISRARFRFFPRFKGKPRIKRTPPRHSFVGKGPSSCG